MNDKMPEFVKKRSGKIEAFDIKKIKGSTLAAIAEGDIPDEQTPWLLDLVTKTVIDCCKDLKTISTKEIRNIILEKLQEKAPHVAQAWVDYEKFKLGLRE